MRVLALDTTGSAGSVAIVDDERVWLSRVGDADRTHAERLPGDLIDALSACGLTASDVDVFAVAAGPGSFTGLRIGIAAVQGLAFVTGRPVVPVSALTALAVAAALDAPAGTIVGAWMNAYRHEVFSALGRVTSARAFAVDRIAEIDPPAVGSPASTWARWTGSGTAPVRVAGDGAVLYASHLAPAVEVVAPPPLAPIIGRIALARARAGASVGPAGVQPLYVRRPDAEIARERS
jgi:tRNA threonylcarbamoyladenosine biosynthesis protein TsaB